MTDPFLDPLRDEFSPTEPSPPEPKTSGRLIVDGVEVDCWRAHGGTGPWVRHRDPRGTIELNPDEIASMRLVDGGYIAESAGDPERIGPLGDVDAPLQKYAARERYQVFLGGTALGDWSEWSAALTKARDCLGTSPAGPVTIMRAGDRLLVGARAALEHAAADWSPLQIYGMLGQVDSGAS